MELGGYGGASELNFLIHLRIVLSGLSGNLCRRQFCFSFKSISVCNEKKKLRAAVRSGVSLASDIFRRCSSEKGPRFLPLCASDIFRRVSSECFLPLLYAGLPFRVSDILRFVSFEWGLPGLPF